MTRANFVAGGVGARGVGERVRRTDDELIGSQHQLRAKSVTRLRLGLHDQAIRAASSAVAPRRWRRRGSFPIFGRRDERDLLTFVRIGAKVPWAP